MKWALGFCVLINCAIASSGCGSSSSSKGLVGSYMVMISSMGRTDSDVMTVAQGSGGQLLLTFDAGITTDAGAPDANGLRADLQGSSVKLASQPVHVDHSTGALDGAISGMGTIKGDGTCDLMMHFVPTSGAALDFEIAGTRL
jgi:hypothetical protein